MLTPSSPDIDACASEARRLDELRLAVLEDRVDADLTAGAGAELVAEIEGLVADHPFRERLWGQLMLALYRSGRQRDALATYQRARSVLVDELGLEPGPELRRLEAAILDHDPALDVSRAEPEAGPGGLPVALEALGPAYVGREAELDWLRSAWVDAASGRAGSCRCSGRKASARPAWSPSSPARSMPRAGSCCTGVVITLTAAPGRCSIMRCAAPGARWPGSTMAARSTIWPVPLLVTGELLTRIRSGASNLFYVISFDPHGRWLTAGSSNGTVRVLDLAAVVDGASGADALVLNQVAHTTTVPSPVISADGILATRGFGDGLVWLWDVATGDLLVEPRADQDQGTPLAFSPDGSYLYYADTGNVLRRYPVDTDELIELAESRLTRGFTDDECRRYLGSTECP